MIRTLRMAFATLLFAASVPNVSQADLVLSYTGKLFTKTSGTAFSTADRITATVTFNAAGDTKAKAFSLSTTMKGGPGFTFHWDVDSQNDLTDSTNDFGWDENGLLPNFWNLLAVGYAAGAADKEDMIGTSNELGDQAFLDLDGSLSYGEAGPGGVWSVVPEPSSFALLAAGTVLGFVVLRRKRSR